MTNKLQRDGFQLLWIITYRNSPQLGGHARDLQTYVETLNAIDGEEITEFYERTLVMLNEIELQEDSTGQSNRLTNRFVTILSEFVDLRPCLRDVTKELTKFIERKTIIRPISIEQFRKYMKMRLKLRMYLPCYYLSIKLDSRIIKGQT